MAIGWRRAIALVVVAAMATLVFLVRRQFGHARELVHPARVRVTDAQTAIAHRDLRGLEDVRLATSDGLALRGWFAPGSTRAAIVFVHGGGGNRAQLLPDATILARHGFGVLTYDSRANGDSDGDLDSLGDREQRDVTAAIDFVSSRADVDPDRIGVVGFSNGAAAAVLEASRDPRVRAVVLYATWSSLEDEMKAKYGRLGPFSWMPLLWALRREGVDVDNVREIDRIAAIAPRPLLMIAGSLDADTPLPVMKRVFAAAGEPKELWIEDGGTHGSDVASAPEEYERRVVAFFERML